MLLTARCPVGLAPSASALSQRQRSAKRSPVVVVRAESQPGSEPPSGEQKKPSSMYIDELPEIKRTELSPEMRARLLKGQYDLGGAPNKKMGTNWFLWISVFIGTLAVLSYLTGAI